MTQQHPAWRRTAAASATLAALGLGIAACGGSDDGSAHPTPAGGASTGAATAPDTATSDTASGGAFAPGSPVDVASVKKMFSDAIDAASTVHVDMRMTGQISMTGAGDMDMKATPVKAALRLSSSTLGGQITMLMLDNAMYLKAAQFGPKYVKVSINDKNSPLSQMGLQSLDPAAMFDRFGDAITGGTYVGKETVDGTPTDHYRLTVDTRAVVSALPSAAASAAAGAATAVPATETLDVWFDGEGRYKQMTTKVGGESVAESFSDWGKPVRIAAPPAAQVQDLSKAMTGAG